MDIPPAPSDAELQQALACAALKLTKRNLRVTHRLIGGETRRQIGDEFQLSSERVYAIFTDVVLVLRKTLFTEAQRQQGFAHYTNAGLDALRQPEVRGWWQSVLERLSEGAMGQQHVLLEKRPSGITLYTRVPKPYE